MVPHRPLTLIPSSGSTTPSAQMAPPAGPAWCPIPRKTLFLRPEAPRPQPKQLRRRGRRGASSPANPCSFVRRHHVPESKRSAGAIGVVPHSPQSLVPSSGSTTPSGQITGVVPHPPLTLVPSSGGTTSLSQNAPPARLAWCLTPRNPLFLRPEAPRP